MTRYIILLFILCVGTAQANEKIHFLTIPDYLSATEAVYAIDFASRNRKYKVSEIDDGALQISIKHNGYNVLLKFIISGKEIYYTDHTTAENFDEPDDDFADEKQGPAPSLIPANWLTSIKKNTVNVFPLIRRIKENMGNVSSGKGEGS